ncbi:hypothetical protein EDB89DRAFT_1901363 [Lactarius sanguifluus]|nr:hypothetical protein EDB89DRAFT_1901363 [Lactarius sanguifluus]
MRATRQLSAIRSPASNVIWFSALGPAIKRLWLKSASVIFGYSQPRVYVIRFSAHPAPRQGIIRYQRGVACHVGVVWGSVVAGVLRVTLKGRGGSWGVVCRVGVARWVGGVLGQGRMEVERPATSRVLHPVLGWCGRLAVVARWGRDKWRWLACTRGGQ